MVWYNLKVGIWGLKMTPLNPIKKELEDVDKDGNKLEKVKGTYTKGHFVDENGKEHSRSFKLINGNPMYKIAKTKEVEKYIEVDLNEIDDLLEEKRYLVEGTPLLNELKASGKALKFGYASGNGYKVYKAYLYPSAVYEGYLMLKLGTTQISEIVGDVVEAQQEKKVQVLENIQGVNRAKVEDLIDIEL